jgi:peroxiredoxin Q/BCP
MEIGEKLPDLLGIDANGKEIKISALGAKKIVLYFYPKDNTPGCTAEACSLRDNYDELTEQGYTIIGVSKDADKSHIKFAEKYSLPFILIADTEHKLAETCGVWQLKKMAGREYMGVVRTTFIADGDGVITNVIRKVDTKNAASQILSL